MEQNGIKRANSAIMWLGSIGLAIAATVPAIFDHFNSSAEEKCPEGEKLVHFTDWTVNKNGLETTEGFTCVPDAPASPH